MYIPSPSLASVRDRRKGVSVDVDEESSCSSSDGARGMRRRGGGGGGRRDDGGMGYGAGVQMPSHMRGMHMAGGPVGGMHTGGFAGGMGLGFGNAGVGIGNPIGGIGGGGHMDAIPPDGRPPAYASNPNFHRYGSGVGGIPPGGHSGVGGGPCGNIHGAGPSPLSALNSPLLPTHYPAKDHKEDFEGVPMGAYTKKDMSDKSGRPRKKDKVSEQLRRGQSSEKKVGSSGKEWIPGDDFLDACTCTTNCTCRKGERVLYRKKDRREGSDSDSDQTTYHSGEIRYILKENLGRDCGDHSGCRKGESESDKERERRKAKKKKEKEQKAQFEGFKEDLLEALDERLERMKKNSHPEGWHSNPIQTPLDPQSSFRTPGYDSSPLGAPFHPSMSRRTWARMGANPGSSSSSSMEMNGISGGMPSATNQYPISVPGGGGMRGAAAMGFEDDMAEAADLDGLAPITTGSGNRYMNSGFVDRGRTQGSAFRPRRRGRMMVMMQPGGRGRRMMTGAGIASRQFHGQGVGVRGKEFGKGKMSVGFSSELDSEEFDRTETQGGRRGAAAGGRGGDRHGKASSSSQGMFFVNYKFELKWN